MRQGWPLARQEVVACQVVAARREVREVEARQEVEVQEVELRQRAGEVGPFRKYSSILSTMHSDPGS